jgi:hypothetical protein
MYMCTEPGCGYRGRFYITIDPDKIKKEHEHDLEGQEEASATEEEPQDEEGNTDD